MKPVPRTALVATALIGIAACSPDRGGLTDLGSTNPLGVTPATVTVAVGDAARFSADTTNAQPASWTVSDSRVAQIEDQTGASVVVHALHPGTTTVTATQAGRIGSAVLVVVAAKLVFSVQPSNAAPGVVLAPAVAVTIEDSSGQPLTSATSAVAVALGTNPRGATLSGTTTVNAVNGTALFTDLRIDRLGTGYTLVATSGTLTGAPSAAFDIRPSKLVFTVQPSYTTAGVALTPAVAVTIEDSSGKPLTGATNAVTVMIAANYSNPDAGLFGTTTVTAVNGVATFGNLSIHAAGSQYYLTASSNGVAPAASAWFAITPAAPAQLSFFGSPSSSWVAQPITPVGAGVAVQDAFGNTVTSATNAVTIAIGVNASGATLSGTTTVNAVSGFATFANLGIDRPGIGYTLAATAPGLTRATSAPFTFNAFASVSAGSWHTCGIALARAAYCWGSNTSGELGNGTTVGGAPPVPVSGGLAFAAVRVGRADTCGLTPAGAAYCWGDNTDGQLGNGTTTNSATPVAVSGGLTFAAVSVGRAHTCGLTPAGVAYCWGDNTYGELGNGTTTNSTAPVAVSGGLTFAAVSAGGDEQLERGVHTCGLTPAGVAYCWGYNAWGQLGNPTSQTCPNAPLPSQCSTTPVPVSGGLTFAAVSAGQDHTCGLTPAGAAYCWGYNTDGQLGNGTTTNSTAPVAVSGGLTFAEVTAGRAPTCGLTLAGAAYCWGYNNDGELGNGTTTPSTTPVPVSGGVAFAAVSAGGLHTCAVTGAGAGYCWGANNAGELGEVVACALGDLVEVTPVLVGSEVSWCGDPGGFTSPSAFRGYRRTP